MENIFNKIKKYNWWENQKFNIGFKRQLYLERILKYIDNKLIKVLIGQRRVGKSYILRQIINFLIIDNKVNPKNIFYLNKEFIGAEEIKNSKDLENLFNFYKQKLKVTGKIYIFLDEVQNIENWEMFVNSYSQDFTSDYEIFITGSNSGLLSSELASFLSGRYVEFEIYPFSFHEFISYKKLEQNKESYLKYLQTGGLPELLTFSDSEIQLHYIESLRNTIILRDIIKRYNIKDVDLLEGIFNFLIVNIGNLTSLNNIVRYFKNQNKKTNYETVSNYTSYLCQTFILHEVDRYNIRGKQILSGVRKYFLNDLAFKNFLFGFTPSDINYNLENEIFMELKRKGFKVNVGVLSNKKIDFIAIKSDKKLYVQVTYLLDSQKTIDREFNNLLSIKDNEEKFVVSMDDLNFSNYQGIKHIRAWEFERMLFDKF
ncbi:MAG: ATP-binding protein [Bacteroidales bacterium]|nr:ATP-binding protein [Bacteroidales bacterium]